MLEDETFKKALESLQVAISSQMWESALRPVSKEDRERLDAMAWATTNLKGCLEKMVVDGAITRDRLIGKQDIAQKEWASVRNIRYGS